MWTPRRNPPLSPTRRSFDPAFFFAIFVVFVAALPCEAPARGRTETFHFDRGRLAFGKTGAYDVVRYTGLDLSLGVGTPQLPVKIVHIPIPPGMSVGEVRVVRTESETIEGRFDLLPVQPPRPLSRPPGAFFEGDAVVYASPDPFPRDVVSAAEGGFAAGFNLSALVVYPLQYVPSEKRLVLHTAIEVEIAYVASARRPLAFRPSAYAERIHRGALETLVERPETLIRAKDLARSSGSALPLEEHAYVIVTNSALAAEFQDLADWKTRKGLSATIVTTEMIQATYTGVDLAEKIRNFIKDAYETWGTVWVLLGGDTNVIPARKTYAMSSGYTASYDEIPCDLYYADLDGDWNANGNATYGEVTDEVDMYPEVFLGRAPVENAAEARDWARKVEIYENWAMRPPGPWHELEMLFLAEILWTNPYTDSADGKNHIDEMFVPPRFDPIEKLYESLYNENWTTVMAALNAGYNIINHSGHAWTNTMGIGYGSLYITDMDGLTNEYRPSVLYSIGCWPAAFDYDCIAERFLTNRVGGGVAFVGNSRFGWGSPGNPLFGYSDRFDQQFFKQLFVDGVHRIGQTLAAAKSFYVPLARQENVYRWCEYEINLLGDPEMPVWTDAAAEMTVTCPEWVPFGNARLPIAVVRALDGRPVEGAFVCAMKQGEVYKTGFTGADGRIELDIAPETPAGDVYLTVTAHNMKVFVTCLAVNSAHPWVQVSSYTTNGSSEGYVTPGSTVNVTACFKNYGDQTATGVSAVLRGAGPSIAMIDSTEWVGTLGPGDSVVVDGAFVFSTGHGLENGDVVQLQCEVTNDEQIVWARKVPVTCATPVIHCDHHAIADAAAGDGDGFAEPGEIVSLNLRLVNAGLAAAEDVIAALDTDSPCLSLPTGVLAFGSLAPGERRTAHAEILVEPSCPQPSFPVVRVLVETAGGRFFADSLVLAVGEMGLRDDMESGEGTWTRAGSPDLWHLSTHRSHSGASSWYCGDEGTRLYAASMNDTLQSAPFTVGDNAELSFWCWYECATYGVDGVFVDVNDGGGWKTLDFLGSGGALGALRVGNDWLEYTYDLSAYPAGTVVELRFRFVSDADAEFGEGVYIDDVSVGKKAPAVVVGIDPPSSGAVRDALYQNHPNPFNPTTTIRFHLSASQRTRVEIFDVRGARVRVLMDEAAGPGPGEVSWDGKDDRGKPVSTGIYFYRLRAGGFTQTRKAVVLQ